MTDLKDWVRSYYTDVWERRNPDAVDDYFSPDVRAEGAFGDTMLSREDIRATAQMLEAYYDRVDVNLVQVLVNGQDVAVLMEMVGKLADSEGVVRAKGQLFATVTDGKFTQFYHGFDFMTLYEQTGQLPADTMAMMLAGESLTPSGH